MSTRRFVTAIGDVNWFEYGGALIFRIGSEHELEVVVPFEDDLAREVGYAYEIYRVPLDGACRGFDRTRRASVSATPSSPSRGIGSTSYERPSSQ